MKIAVVTFEFPRLTKNGGIGTAYGRMVKHLEEHGHNVSVYFVDVLGILPPQMQKLQGFFRYPGEKTRIKIIRPKVETLSHVVPWPVQRTIAVSNALVGTKYDIIHFHECLGLGWSFCKLHKYGLIPNQKTKVILGAHGPNFWVRDAHQKPTEDLNEFLESNLEKELFQDSQEVVSPSQYLLDFLFGHRWERKPHSTRVIPNVTHFTDLDYSKTCRRPSRLVFFGRLESRKGIALFAEALLLLGKMMKTRHLRPIDVDFLGKDTLLPNAGPASQWVKNKLASAKNFNVTFYTDLSSEDCKRYFAANPNALLIMPSLADNSPYAVVEALEQRLNFICTNVGGQTELVDETLSNCTVAPSARALAGLMFEKLQAKDSKRPQPSRHLLSSNEKWIKFHEELESPSYRPSIENLRKKLVVMIKSSGNLVALNKTLFSISSQKVAIDRVYVHLQSTFLKGSDSLILLKNLIEMHKNIDIQASLQFGGWHDEMFLKTQSQSAAEFMLPLVEGDEVQPGFFKRLCSIFAQAQSIDGFIFGYSAAGKSHQLGPLSFENNFMFDYICKFPCIFRRDLVFSKTTAADCILSHYFSLKTEHLFRLSMGGHLIESIPLEALRNDAREPFYPSWIIKRDELKRRLDVVSPNLNRESRAVIENFHDMLNSKRND